MDLVRPFTGNYHVDATLQFKRRPSHVIDDVAYDFIENEVGRHDWSNNWQKWRREKPDLKERVQAWLDRYQIDQEPQGLIDFLDSMVQTRVGKWR